MVVTAVYSVELCDDQLRFLEDVIRDRSKVEVKVCRNKDGGIYGLSNAGLSREELAEVFEDGLDNRFNREYLPDKPTYDD
jgi:hypothetical protein